MPRHRWCTTLTAEPHPPCRACRCEQHDSQLSPQCAAALAADALKWLAGLPLQQLLQEACSVFSSSGSSDQQAAAAAARVSPYPALAAASAAASGSASEYEALLLGTLGAALHFVGSYWSVQSWHTAAEKAAAGAQLAQLGLLPAGSEAGGGAEPPALQQSVSSLLESAVAVDALWPSPASGMAAAAAAAAELGVAVSRLAATFLRYSEASGVAGSLLAPLFSQQAASRFLQAAQGADATLSQPWDAARQAQLLPLLRAALAGLQGAAHSHARQEGSSGAPPLRSAAIDTCLALLMLLPPGDESAALQVLALLLGERQLAGAAAATAEALQAAGGKTAELASGHGLDAAADGSSPPALPDARHLSQVLLAGYAAPWLALVPERPGGRAQRAADPSGPDPPPTSAVLRPQGMATVLPGTAELITLVSLLFGWPAAQEPKLC